MLRKLLEEHTVTTTALLANYWKLIAKAKENWQEICLERGERQKDLFKDPLMQHFVDPVIKSEAEHRLDKRMWLPLATRTRFFRRTISRAVKHKDIKQIIILGSGFDTLPARKLKYSEQFGVKFFEVDQPNLLECKRMIYAELQINQNAEYIGSDYVKNDLIESLKKRSIDFNLPTLILWEGNTFYLEKQEVIIILQMLAKNFAHPIITFDYMHAAMQTQSTQLDQAANEKSLEKTLEQFSKKKSPFKTFFAPTEIVALCEGLGIQCIDHKTAAELAKEYGVDNKPYYTAETYSVVTFERR
jgi:methyltransferase (TIGR00027 family)